MPCFGQDLEKYVNFAKKFDPSYAAKSGSMGGGMKINWPNAPGGGSGNMYGASSMQNEDDLYN